MGIRIDILDLLIDYELTIQRCYDMSRNYFFYKTVILKLMSPQYSLTFYSFFLPLFLSLMLFSLLQIDFDDYMKSSYSLVFVNIS